jgi:putative hydrolase of the HAD superfamily
MIHPASIRAITLDLDDTLWPIAPTMVRAEAILQHYLREHAPATAVLCGEQGALLRIRQQLQREWPDRLHDLSALRRESIRRALLEAGEDPTLAEPAFDLYFDARQQVDLYEDALEGLAYLAARYPVVALSNGNADVHRVGLGRYFHAAVSAQAFGVAKPDPRIFHEAAARAGVPAEAVLHIGDDPHLDVHGARGVGMQCVWINRHAHAWPEGSAQPLTLTSLRDLIDHLPA